jgi:hypothetical protein
MKASQALRGAYSELNSCSSPSSEDLRVLIAQRTLAFRRVLVLADRVIGRPRLPKHPRAGSGQRTVAPTNAPR